MLNEGGVYMLSPLIACNNFIKKAAEEKTSMTPLKIQKLLYMLYSCYYRQTGRPLFSDQFVVWPYGPVLTVVYDEFKKYKSGNITDFHYSSDGKVYVVDEDDEEFQKTFDLVWNKYGHDTGVKLSNMTHKEGTAWYRAENYGDILKLEDTKDDARRWFEK